MNASSSPDRSGIAQRPGWPAGLPVALVIPVRDEALTIDALLESIDAQTAPPAQVIFVDAGSTDGTASILSERAMGRPRYSLVEAGGVATPGRARNLGVAAASHEWLAMTDAGITLEPTWLQRLWEAHLDDPQAGVVYGNYEFDVHSLFEECASVAYGVPKRATPSGLCRGPQVVSCLVRRAAFDAVGGFVDRRAGEDESFVRALESGGVRAAWAPGATVWWRLRPDFPSTFERFRLYSYHYVLGGEKRLWHHRLRRGYQPVAAGLLLSMIHSPRWLLLAGGTLSARVAIRLRRHRHDRDWSWLLRPDRVGLITLLMVSTDAATALGWWQAEATRRRQRQLDGGRSAGYTRRGAG